MSENKMIESNRFYHAQQPVTVGTEDIHLNRAELQAGAQAGVGAGFLMGILAIIVALSSGQGLWAPFNDVASAFIRPVMGAGQAFSLVAVFASLLVHLVLSASLGALFAAIYSGWIKLTFGFGMPIVVGVVFGLITWVVARYFGLPLLNSAMYQEPAFLTAHAVFGAALGLLYPFMPVRQQDDS
jgi:hypothetical protein